MDNVIRCHCGIGGEACEDREIVINEESKCLNVRVSGLESPIYLDKDDALKLIEGLQRIIQHIETR